MDRMTRWISLLGGCFLLVIGMKRLYREGDWVLAIIGAFIIAFSVLSMVKNRQSKG